MVFEKNLNKYMITSMFLFIFFAVTHHTLVLSEKTPQSYLFGYVIYRLPALNTEKPCPHLLKVPATSRVNRNYRVISFYMLSGEKKRIVCRDAFVRIDFSEDRGRYILASIKLIVISLDNESKIVLANSVLIDKKTREVFLLNGTRLGVTAVWLPLSWLKHDKSMRVSETLGMKSIKYSPQGEYLVHFKWLGWREAYVISASMSDREAAIIITRDDILRERETEYWKVLKIYSKYSEDLKRNATFALVLWKTDNTTEEILLEGYFREARLKKGYYLTGVGAYDAETGLASRLPVIDPLWVALGVKINFEDFYLYKYEKNVFERKFSEQYILEGLTESP
ncbi:MAG: hypothetical protein DRJ52_11415 [Thermoprotei archaeon]|nr:MAG: hypothetical protein DRJ52_11415 [Thermoprotei archaeon]